MIDLNRIEHIYMYPSVTDMRLGIFGLKKKIIAIESEIKVNSLYLFLGTLQNQIKIIHIDEGSTWLYQNKLNKGKFIWPSINDKTEINKEQLTYIVSGISQIKSIGCQKNLALF